jgi:hypothetical protein
MLATLALLQGAQAEAFLEAQGVQFWALREPGPATGSRRRDGLSS